MEPKQTAGSGLGYATVYCSLSPTLYRNASIIWLSLIWLSCLISHTWGHFWSSCSLNSQHKSSLSSAQIFIATFPHIHFLCLLSHTYLRECTLLIQKRQEPKWLGQEQILHRKETHYTLQGTHCCLHHPLKRFFPGASPPYDTKTSLLETCSNSPLPVLSLTRIGSLLLNVIVSQGSSSSL